MTALEKMMIQDLQRKGYGYKKIATELNLPVNSVKSYCRRHGEDEILPVGMCPQCGRTVVQKPHRKQKKFCSDKCRMAWWKEHPDSIQRKEPFEFRCACCGVSFTSRSSKRVYCSKDCYAKGRSGRTEE